MGRNRNLKMAVKNDNGNKGRSQKKPKPKKVLEKNEGDIKPLTAYNKGDDFEGSEIELIYGQSKYCLIFQSKDYTLRYGTRHTEEIPLYAEKCAHFLHLFSQMPRDLPRSVSGKIINQLAVTFFGSMKPNNKKNPTEYFKYIENKIVDANLYAENTRYRRLIFVSFIISIIFWLFLCLVPLCCSPSDFKVIYLAVPAGFLGSFLSILQRKNTISMSRFINWEQIILASFASLATGALAGAVTYLLIKSELIFGGLDFSQEAIFVLCFLSGLSERYFNSLLNRAENLESVDKKT